MPCQSALKPVILVETSKIVVSCKEEEQDYDDEYDKPGAATSATSAKSHYASLRFYIPCFLQGHSIIRC